MCVWDAGGGFAGIGRLNLMPDYSQRALKMFTKHMLQESLCRDPLCFMALYKVGN